MVLVAFITVNGKIKEVVADLNPVPKGGVIPASIVISQPASF
jgi:hypothetical protein